MMMMIITMIIISAVLYSTFVRKGLLECVCVCFLLLFGVDKLSLLGVCFACSECSAGTCCLLWFCWEPSCLH